MLHRRRCCRCPRLSRRLSSAREFTACLRIRWKERDQIVCAGKFSYANPPKNIAAVAVARNFADWPDAERTRNMIAAFGVDNGPTMPDLCVEVSSDVPADEVPESDIPPGMVEKIGEPRRGEIAINRI